MADNGDNLIEYGDLTWSGTTAYFHLTSNRPYLVLAEGMGNVQIVGHGYSLTGSGNVGLDLGSTNYGVRIDDLNITGSFRYGMRGENVHGLTLVDVDVSNSTYMGMELYGNDMLIRYSDVSNIGSNSSLEIVGGMSLHGSRINVDQAHIFGVRSAVETYGVGFNLYGGTDCLLSNSTLVGGTGWSFPVWDRTTGSEIYNTYAHGWSQIGSVYGIDITWSTIITAWQGGQWTADPTSSVTHTGYSTPDANGWIWGTSGRDHLGGTAADDILHGGAGNDVLAGFGGADTFVFHPAANEIDIAADFTPGVDRIDVSTYTFATRLEFGAALQAGPCMVWDAGEHVLWYDSNGNLPGGIVGGMYLPYGTQISAIDLIF